MVKLNVNTTSYALLKVSPSVFLEIELRLRLSGSDHPFHLMDTGAGTLIDMAGICITPDLDIPVTDPPIVDLRVLLESKR